MTPEAAAWLQAEYEHKQQAKAPDGSDKPFSTTSAKHFGEWIRALAEGAGISVSTEAEALAFGQQLRALLESGGVGSHSHNVTVTVDDA